MSTRVRIIGDHPHLGSAGTVRDDLPMVHGMWRIELDPDARTEACFADPANLRPLDPSEDYYA
jgi:hypothetical protein